MAGHRILVFDEVDSTNRIVKEMALKGAEDGLCVRAKSQTGGRGRLGRSFFSPEGGLYMSLLIRSENALSSPLLVTSLAAVAIRRALLARTGLSCGIKWVNDIYCAGRKIAGILAEAVTVNGKVSAVVLGAGINIAQERFPEELDGIVTSAAREGGRPVTPDELMLSVLSETDALLGALPDASFMEEYARHSILTGRQVTVTGQGEPYRALVVGIAGDGSLIVERDGKRRLISSGEVTLRPA